MTEQPKDEALKKDLTGLIQVSKDLEAAGQAPQAPEGAIFEETPIEKIDTFESLEDYSANSASTTSPVTANNETATGATTNTAAIANTESETPSQTTADFPITESPPLVSENFPSSSSTTIEPAEPAFVTTEAAPTNDAAAPTAEDTTATPSSELDFPATLPNTATDAAVETSPEAIPPASTQDELSTSPTPAPASLAAVKNYSEQATATQPNVPASFPFSLLIEGPLTPAEKEKILDAVVGQNMGIREIDLEPQLQAGRILIPRVSEYAAIFLVQTLRGISAQIKMGPSDSIFATSETRTSPNEERNSLQPPTQSSIQSFSNHPAEELPITTQASLPQFSNYSILDTLSASAVLQSTSIETDSSSEYQDLIEALQREIKYKAYRRGAAGILSYHTQITPLASASLYRVHATGLAIKAASEQLQVQADVSTHEDQPSTESVPDLRENEGFKTLS